MSPQIGTPLARARQERALPPSRARRNRVESVGGGLPRDIVVLILVSSFVIVAYAVLVGSPSFWFHVLGPAAIAMVVAISLVVLVDLTNPFSGDVAIAPDDFKTGALSPFFHSPNDLQRPNRSRRHESVGRIRRGLAWASVP
jgi:hypothetical protein